MSSALQLEESIKDADLTIGAVLIPGALAPKLGYARDAADDEGELGLRRRRDRPGGCADVEADDTRRPRVHGRRRHSLLRREHAGRSSDHVDPRADERHASVRRAARGSRFTRGCGCEPGPGAGREHSSAGGSRTRRSRKPMAWSTRRWTTFPPPAWSEVTIDPEQYADAVKRLEQEYVDGGMTADEYTRRRRDLERRASTDEPDSQPASLEPMPPAPEEQPTARVGDASTIEAELATWGRRRRMVRRPAGVRRRVHRDLRVRTGDRGHNHRRDQLDWRSVDVPRLVRRPDAVRLAHGRCVGADAREERPWA